MQVNSHRLAEAIALRGEASYVVIARERRRSIDDELSRTQRVCEAVGDDSLSAELCQTVVTLSDEWTKYQRLHARSPTSRRHRRRVPWSRLRT